MKTSVNTIFLSENSVKNIGSFLAYLGASLTEIVGDVKSENSPEYYEGISELSKSLSSFKSIENDMGIDEISSAKNIQKLPKNFIKLWKTSESEIEKKIYLNLVFPVECKVNETIHQMISQNNFIANYDSTAQNSLSDTIKPLKVRFDLEDIGNNEIYSIFKHNLKNIDFVLSVGGKI